MVIGIDYSMTCPAMCLRRADGSREFWCSVARKTPFARVPDHITVNYHQETNVIIRAQEIGEALLAQIDRWHVQPSDLIGLEDYAYSASGRVFHIGEHGGILKYLFLQRHIATLPIAPTQAKKTAGKGNFDKTAMTEAFFRVYPAAKHWPDAFFDLNKKKNIYDSPVTDLADAFWIAETVWSQSVREG